MLCTYYLPIEIQFHVSLKAGSSPLTTKYSPHTNTSTEAPAKGHSVQGSTPHYELNPTATTTPRGDVDFCSL